MINTVNDKIPNNVLHIITDKTKWKSVLNKAIIYDFYHTYDYHITEAKIQKGKAILLFFKEEEYCIGFPLIIREISKVKGLEKILYRDATSVYGYAGLIRSHNKYPLEFITNFMSKINDYFISNKIISVFSRLHPLIDNSDCFKQYGELISLSTTISINLLKESEEIFKGYRKSLKYDINKLRKSDIQCLHDENFKYLDESINIYLDNMKRVNASEYYFFDKNYFYNFCKSKDFDTHLFVCKMGEEIISGALFVRCNGIIQYHLAGTKEEYLKFGSMKLILDEVRIWAQKSGANILHLGGGFGSKEDSLFKFKSGFSKDRNIFKIWRYVVDQEAYNNVEKIKEDWNKKNGFRFSNSDFFPKYRSEVELNNL